LWWFKKQICSARQRASVPHNVDVRSHGSGS
jgi:hypothetical protein